MAMDTDTGTPEAVVASQTGISLAALRELRKTVGGWRRRGAGGIVWSEEGISQLKAAVGLAEKKQEGGAEPAATVPPEFATASAAGQPEPAGPLSLRVTRLPLNNRILICTDGRRQNLRLKVRPSPNWRPGLEVPDCHPIPSADGDFYEFAGRPPRWPGRW